jgi:hypothetical protein
MIQKRRTLSSGPPGGLGGTDHLSEDHKKLLSMGEDEEKEALPEEAIALRTWWRNWLKIR